MSNTEHTSPHRRQWTAIEKLQIVEESQAAGASMAEVARRYNLSTGLIYTWRRQAKAGALSGGPASQSRFALVAIASGKDAAHPISSDEGAATVEVVLRNGRILRLTERAGPGRAAVLADALEGVRL
jgi:transposase